MPQTAYYAVEVMYMCSRKHDIVSCFDEVEAYLCSINRGNKNCCKSKNPGYSFDFGWRFTAAFENLKLKLCGHRRR